MKIILPGCRPLSWNSIYQSKHWSYRKTYVDDAHAEVYSALNSMGIAPLSGKNIIQQRVDIRLTGYYKNRIVDADNLCSKIFLDPLKGILLVDDSPKYVRSVTTQCEIDKKNPRLEIEIIPIDNLREK